MLINVYSELCSFFVMFELAGRILVTWCLNNRLANFRRLRSVWKTLSSSRSRTCSCIHYITLCGMVLEESRDYSTVLQRLIRLGCCFRNQFFSGAFCRNLFGLLFEKAPKISFGSGKLFLLINRNYMKTLSIFRIFLENWFWEQSLVQVLTNSVFIVCR